MMRKSNHKPTPYRTAAILAVIVLLALGLFRVLDLIAYPWAHSVIGPALVGNWEGEFVTASGRRYAIVLDLEDERIGTKSHQKRIRADVRVCSANPDTERGTERRTAARTYEGSGRLGNWRGTRFHLDLRANDGREDGVAYVTLDGRWDRRDRLNTMVVLKPGGSTATVVADRVGQGFRPGVDPDLHRPIDLALYRADGGRFCR